MATYADLLDESMRRQRRGGMEHTSDIDDYRRKLKGALSAIDQSAAGIAKLFPQMTDTPEDVAYKTAQWVMPSAGLQDAKNLGKGALQAIGVWHGSPHKFDKFDLSKIGTGEGAQAYGHGLYFAESPAVAEAYRQALSPGRGADHADIAARIMETAGGDTARALEIVGQRRKIGNLPGAQEKWDAVESMIRSGVDPQGSLYKTSLEWPDPTREAADPMGPQYFLDWDLPLSEQSDTVKKAWEAFKNTPAWKRADASMHGDLSGAKGAYQNPTGKDFRGALYEGFASKNGGEDAKVTKFLKAQGLPGIKYLDAGSRGAGNGSRNYVVFDDQIPKIQERNGVSIADLMRR